MLTDFDWDPVKATANLSKHGVSFGEAATTFGDPLGLDRPDEVHSSEERRFLRLGRSYLGRVLVVAYTERRSCIRMISARRATARERRDYEQR